MSCSFINSFLHQVSQYSFQVYKAVDACKSVLRGLHSNQIAPRELDRVSCLFCLLSLALISLFSLLKVVLFVNQQAKRTLLMRHEAELKSNAYWLNLLAHLQASSVPRKVMVTCIFLNVSFLT